MRTRLYLISVLQILGTCLILFFVQDSVIATILLLIFWFITFRPIAVHEYSLFFLTGLGMAGAQILTPTPHLFSFAEHNFFTLPWYEFVMWGFYILIAYRLCDTTEQKMHGTNMIRALILLMFFLASFAFFSGSASMLTLSLIVTVGISIVFFHTKRDLQYMGVFLILCLSIEFTGAQASLWQYPSIYESIRIGTIVPGWGVLYWIGTGLFLSRIIVPLVSRSYRLRSFTKR